MRSTVLSVKLTGIVVTTAALLVGMAAPALAQLTAQDIADLRARGQREGWTFAVRENPATALPLEALCGLVPPPGWQENARFDPCRPSRDLPSAFNWHNFNGQDLCPPVRNQGGCGSCWAFATVGPLECNIKIQSGTNVDLSEQWLVSCNSDGWSCAGGWWAHDYHQWKQDPCHESGAVLEADYPYTGLDTPCDCPRPHPYRISSWAYIGGGDPIPPVDAIKQAIMDYGPVCVAICVDGAFQAYYGGVFNACSSGQINHGVVLVGWNDADGGYWIMRNSWGSGWGEDGYMRIRYNCSSIGYAATYVVFTPPASIAVSGRVLNASGQGIAGVTLHGLPGLPVTSGTGSYWSFVSFGWSGVVTPTKPGYTFVPTSRSYVHVAMNQTLQNYTGTMQRFTISGTVATASGTGIAGVTMSGLPGDPVTNETGFYTATVDGGWSGTVTPAKAGCTFIPASQSYTEVAANQTENYTGNVLGDLNCDGVVDFADINPFVQALAGYDAYQSVHPNCTWLNADCNADGQVNFADINAFAALLAE